MAETDLRWLTCMSRACGDPPLVSDTRPALPVSRQARLILIGGYACIGASPFLLLGSPKDSAETWTALLPAPNTIFRCTDVRPQPLPSHNGSCRGKDVLLT